ncbi:AGE family epimerase/isomerase [Nocardiopsis sp. RSe5-2]|uniref:AGE family epimerase/isomerase n=1 Tax=Nocardiopsis endophytica TaxID=3018445 RepID=A0ABT4U499_9ACTN|nr:AGE family epimerase/isomerase [Nocardiopsis endophytica]MDA2811536.1 AGE family epimerase/isomerase [Nocardiopsis endophytica]
MDPTPEHTAPAVPGGTAVPGVDPAWLAAEERRVAGFARPAALPEGGFGWLDEAGRPVPGGTAHTWITCRMTHVFSLAHLRGDDGAAALADHGVAALRGRLRDAEHGGWFASSDEGAGAKGAYEHAFVVLAASSAAQAGRPGAEELLAEVLGVVEDRFFDAAEGLCVEGWDRAWRECEAYRGANSNMHMVEAFLAAADATGDRVWRDRALGIADRLIRGETAANGWRLPEHFTPDWEQDLDYNRDAPADPFRPFGTTVGHWLEWARLLVNLEATLGEQAPEWLLEDARRLFDLSCGHGWAVDGSDGFVYTLDWEDRPVVRERMHWVAAEATAAAAVLWARTGEEGYAERYREWWDFIRERHLDEVHGGWHHELAPDGSPSSTVWRGKPDAYHAYQAVLIPRLPVSGSVAGAVAANAGADPAGG